MTKVVKSRRSWQMFPEHGQILTAHWPTSDPVEMKYVQF